MKLLATSSLRLLVLVLLLVLARLSAPAQSVGIGTVAPAASAALDAASTTQGLLPPRLTQAQRDAIATPAVGLTLYNTAANAGGGDILGWAGGSAAYWRNSASAPYPYVARGGEGRGSSFADASAASDVVHIPAVSAGGLVSSALLVVAPRGCGKPCQWPASE